MIQCAIPVLHVSEAAAAEKFYRDQLGFRLEFAYRPDPRLADPCYMGFSREGARLHVSSFAGDGVCGGVVNLLVDDVDALYVVLLANGVRIDAGHPVNQTWGTREMYVRDDDGNSIRFQAPRQV